MIEEGGGRPLPSHKKNNNTVANNDDKISKKTQCVCIGTISSIKLYIHIRTCKEKGQERVMEWGVSELKEKQEK